MFKTALSRRTARPAVPVRPSQSLRALLGSEHDRFRRPVMNGERDALMSMLFG